MRRAVASVLTACLLGACGLEIQPADLFLLTRVGEGQKLTLLVSDGGTVRCDGGRSRPLPDPLLLEARDLSSALNTDAASHLKIPAPANSVYRYTVELQNGTITFPDTAGDTHPNLAQTELFTVQAARQACGLSG